MKEGDAMKLFIKPLIVSVLLAACQPAEKKPPTSQASQRASPQVSQISIPEESPADYSLVASIIANSCLPCHNRQTLGDVIQLTQDARFAGAGDETRLRVLAALQRLASDMDEGIARNFTTQQEIEQLMHLNPELLPLVLEKGVMPPQWASDLMRKIDWPNYQALTVENRVEILQYTTQWPQNNP